MALACAGGGFAGCGGSKNTSFLRLGPADAIGTSGTFDGQGGSLSAPSGHALAGTSLHLPADALARAATVTIEPASVPAGAIAAGPVVQVGPAATSFMQPVTVTVPFDHAAIPAGQTESGLLLLFEATPGGPVTALPTQVDAAI